MTLSSSKDLVNSATCSDPFHGYTADVPCATSIPPSSGCTKPRDRSTSVRWTQHRKQAHEGGQDGSSNGGVALPLTPWDVH